MLKAVLFDLDGTLLPMNEKAFIAKYDRLVTTKFANKGYDYKQINKVFWEAFYKMYENDGSKVNFEVFWDHLAVRFGQDFLKEKPVVYEFFNNEFIDVKTEFLPNPLAKDIVKFVKDNNLLCILATNPVFPLDGVLNRMDYVGLEESDFDYITNSENFRFVKANPKYYKEILDKFNLKSDEVLMFGNHSYEDGESALANNIKTYLIEGCIYLDPKATHEFETIKMDQVISTIRKYINIR